MEPIRKQKALGEFALGNARDLTWAGEDSPGEAGDLLSTLADVRAFLAGGAEDRVTVRVGTRSFGEKLLARLEAHERERVRVVVTSE